MTTAKRTKMVLGGLWHGKNSYLGEGGRADDGQKGGKNRAKHRKGGPPRRKPERVGLHVIFFRETLEGPWGKRKGAHLLRRVLIVERGKMAVS